MKSKVFTFSVNDGSEISCYKWEMDNTKYARGVLYIAHGMAEHSKRYERFAEFLTNAGFIVYANDHRGHGKTQELYGQMGYFSDKNGWGKVVDDMAFLIDIIKNENKELPVFMLGHSMGSLLARTFITYYSEKIDGLMISGTAFDAGMLGSIGLLIAKIQKFFAKKKPSKLMDKLSFGSFNNKFKPNRTDFDWLSRDNNEVDKYINDKWCGQVFTSSFYVDLLKGTKYIHKKNNLDSIRKDLPIAIFSGADDPVGNFGKGIKLVEKLYKDIGIADVSCKLYEGARHEILNETNRTQVFSDMLDWLQKHSK